VPLFLCIVVKNQDLLNILQDIAPDGLAETWDNVGLLVGSPDDRVSSVLLALDPLVPLIAEAKRCGAELIVTHHPAIFRPLKSLRTDRPDGRFLAAAVRAGINVVGCHTNLDAACGGVNDVLADLLGLQNTTPLLPDRSESCAAPCGLGRIGILPEPVLPEEFLAKVHAALSPPWLLEAGPRPEHVAKVAVCGGSCSDISETALTAGADVFLTAEIKHNIACWAEEAGLWLIDGGHFATEYPAVQGLARLLSDRLQQAGMDVEVHCACQKPPLRLAGKRN
jgi:dinuclear metal center YbgI/SA1388 family protein